MPHRCTFQILGGLSGSEDRGGGDTSIQFINFGRVGDKSFKDLGEKMGGGRVGDFFILLYLIKNATFLYIFIHICLFIKLKKLHVWQFFLFVFVKFRNS